MILQKSKLHLKRVKIEKMKIEITKEDHYKKEFSNIKKRVLERGLRKRNM